MPNWVRGDLKIRGEKDNIKKFLLDNLIQDDRQIIEDENNLILVSLEGFHINGTLENCALKVIGFFASDEKVKEFKIKKIMAFREISPEPYIIFSNRYDIDIEIVASNYFGGYYQKIEINKGEIVENELLDYFIDDWGQKQSLKSNAEETIEDSMFLDMFL